MKKVLAGLLSILMVGSMCCTAFAQTPHEVAVYPEIYAHGMLIGRGDGDFALDALVTRAEMAQFSVNAMNLKGIPGSVYYTDMAGHWAEGAANLAHDMGATPWNDTEFQPENAVTYAEAVQIIVTLLGYAPQAEAEGSHGYLMTGMRIGVTEGVQFVAEDFATRGDVATMLENAMMVPIMQQVGFGAYEEFQIMDGKNGIPLVTLKNNF